MGVGLWAAGAFFTLTAGVAAAQEAADPAAARAAADYCLAVAEAYVTGAPPVATGPEGFQQRSGLYGALHWLKGEWRAAGSIVASPGEGDTCTVIANNLEASAIPRWFERDQRYFPANEHENPLVRAVDGGWVRIGWSQAPIGGATMVIVHGLKAAE